MAPKTFLHFLFIFILITLVKVILEIGNIDKEMVHLFMKRWIIRIAAFYIFPFRVATGIHC